MGFIGSREDYGLRVYDLRDLLRRGIFPILSIQLQPYGSLRPNYTLRRRPFFHISLNLIQR